MNKLLLFAVCVNSVSAGTILPASGTPTVAAPTLSPTPFTTPQLPISKDDPLYPQCKVEVIFLIDFSGSVTFANQDLTKKFSQQVMYEIEKNILEARFSLSFFSNAGAEATRGGGCPGDLTQKERQNYPRLSPRTNTDSLTDTAGFKGIDTIFDLGPLKKNAAGLSQFDVIDNLDNGCGNTPTAYAFQEAQYQFEQFGDPNVPGRFVILLTDGAPTTLAGTSSEFVNEQRDILANGTMIMTVGVGLKDNPTVQDLMVKWATEPKSLTAYPEIPFDEIADLVPKILDLMCPDVQQIAQCLDNKADGVDIVGKFLKTNNLGCKFVNTLTDDPPVFVNNPRFKKGTGANEGNNTLECKFPDEFFPGEYLVQFTTDGRGYTDAFPFKYGTICTAEVLFIAWPLFALVLLPLAFARRRKVVPKIATKKTAGVAKAAPMMDEEYTEYEEVEEVVEISKPKSKWAVAPTAYIGFGQARLSVDWAGAAPESAPHQGVRKMVVKRRKVVNDGPAAGVVQERGPDITFNDVEGEEEKFVEEPDWMNGLMDKVEGLLGCCPCCKKAK